MVSLSVWGDGRRSASSSPMAYPGFTSGAQRFRNSGEGEGGGRQLMACAGAYGPCKGPYGVLKCTVHPPFARCRGRYFS
ncbi:hypothetical protein GCM10010357_33590 [Streptomyces luteireticuli]|uniref:Uncharacterized protein n=1 Tax=Streptomyces luteireticuli TaxID=173858 RepID=A0ABP3IM26_9ACTN